jgi:Transposase DDE domain
MRTHCTGLAALTHWLTPQVWKNAHQSHRPRQTAPRWGLHPLVMVAALMTWTTGDSEAERFAAARAFYVARHQREKRPGQSLPGFQKALAQLPLPVLHALFAAVRRRLLNLYERHWSSGGFVVMACDGSRLACPRSRELEKRLGCCSKPESAPMLYVTTLVLLPAGLLWSWCVGPGTASELAQLQQLLPTVPRCALIVGDAAYLSYDLYANILNTRASFLIRMSSKAYLYTDQQQVMTHYRQGLVWYWPQDARKQGRPPLRLRLIRVRGKKGKDVWLLTSVLESERLSRQQASEIYRWRWRSEGVFRTYKRTLPKLKLWSRTEALVYREAEVSLLALQLLLVQGIRCRSGAMTMDGSPRQILLRLRGEITTTIGAQLGPRQLRRYRRDLEQVRRGGPGRRVRRKWPRRRDHKPPKPPHVRVLPAGLKAKMNNYFNAARGRTC